jgi:hypothetical protein
MIIRDVWQWVLVPDFHRTTASKKSDEGRPEANDNRLNVHQNW